MGRRGLFLFGGTVLTLMLQIGAGALGSVGALLNFLIPLPAAYAHMRAGSVIGGIIVVASTGVLAGIGEVEAAVGYVLQFGFASFLLPFFLRRSWSWDRVVAMTTLCVLGLGGLALGGYTLSQGTPVRQLVQNYVQKEVTQALNIYQQSNVTPEQKEDLDRFGQHLTDYLVSAYPALALTVTWIMLLFTVYLLSVLSAGNYAISGPPFYLWHVHPLLVWGLIGGGFGLVFFDGPLEVIALNLLTVVLPIYFLNGLAIVSYFFRKKNISPAFRALGFLLIVVLNPLPLIVTGFGVFDLWADFRKPKIKET